MRSLDARSCPLVLLKPDPTHETPPACSRLAAVRSPARYCEAGNRAERFVAASSFCAIRGLRVSNVGAGRDGKRWSWVLLAAGWKGTSEGRFPGGRSRPPAESRPCALQDR